MARGKLEFHRMGGIHACAFLPLLLLGNNRRHSGEVVAHGRKLPTIKEFVQMLSTFIFVTAAWVFFRVSNIGDAAGILKRILVDSVRHPGQYLQPGQHLTNTAVFWAVPLFLLDWNFRRDERSPLKPLKARYFYYIILGILIVLAFNKKTNFIYFQF